MFDLVGKRYLFLTISLIVIIPGVISLIFRGLNVGIDFAGGANIQLRPQSQVTIAQMSKLVSPFNLADLQVVTGDNPQLPAKQTVWIRLNTQIDKNVQNALTHDLQAKYGSQLEVNFDDLSLIPTTGGNAKTVTVATPSKFQQGVTPQISEIKSVLSKLPNTSNPAKGAATSSPSPTPTVTPSSSSNPANIPVKVDDVIQGTTTQTVSLLTRSVIDNQILGKMQSHFVNSGIYMSVLQNATVSGSVAAETTRNAVLAVIAASVLILLYIWFAFRKVDRPWRYGTCAVIALLHDVLVVLGVFSILGWLIGFQVDALFITALLTVVGFSVHDTIVVFDRIRENMTRRTSETFDQVVNASLVQTMARSLNTSLTVIFTLSALTLFGGATIRPFTLALLVGIVSGTYSSIFNASMLLVMWDRHEFVFGLFGRARTSDRREARELVRTR